MANPLELFLNTIRNMIAAGQLTKAAEYGNGSLDILTRNASNLDTILEGLDIQTHTLIYLFVLRAKFNASQLIDTEALITQTMVFLCNCNPEQVRLAPDAFCAVVHIFTRLLVDRREAIRGIRPCLQSVKALQQSPNQLTAVHADLCQLALLAKVFKPVLPVLDIDLADINTESNCFDAKDFLLYYYYGGMVYLAVKNYERAAHFFELSLYVPSVCISQIMVESFKKYLLVSLYLHGRMPNDQRSIVNKLQRNYKNLIGPYADLLTAFRANDVHMLDSFVEKHSEVFKRDQNFGLVKQCRNRLVKMNIHCLTKTFLTLSLSDVATRTKLSSPAEAERYLLQMIEEGTIFARINQKDGMVQFLDNPEKYNNPGMLQRINKEMDTCMSLENELVELNREIVTNPKYVQKLMNSEEAVNNPKGAPFKVGMSVGMNH